MKLTQILPTLLLLIAVGPLRAQTELPAQPAIRVSGIGTAVGQPDLATLHIAIVTNAATAEVAAAENAKGVASVLTALRAVMGAGSSIVTVTYTLQAEYDYREGNAPRLKSYVARNMLRVETGDLDKVGAIIDAATRAGANEITTVSFSQRNTDKLRAEALTLAARDARAKAEALASATGVRLGGLRLAEEGSTARPFDATMKRTAETGTPIELGPVTLDAVVTLTYDIAR